MNKCNLCQEAELNVGDRTNYGAIIIYKIGDDKDGWFATLSPKTGGDPDKDFSIQLMPCAHIKYFSDINSNLKLAKNYGIIFAKINHAISEIIKDQNPNTKKISLGTYGKCKHEDEHIHIKIFPYRGNIGQPFTTDSSFGKNLHIDDSGKEYIKMIPITKVNLKEQRFKKLAKQLIQIIKNEK
jgi:hypothetical protein